MKLVSIVLSIIVFINTSIVNSVDEKHDFDLLEYCLSHQISSQSEFNDVLMCYCGVEEDDLFVLKNEESFQIIVDIPEMMICTIVMEEPDITRQVASNEVSRNYYGIDGARIFTITVEGTFQYNGIICTCTSASGSYTKPSSSGWTSVPTISSGMTSSFKGFAKISGTATYLNQSKTYSLTLTCDGSGNFDAY